MDALQNPVKRAYNRKELHSEDFPIAQKADIDLDSPIIHGEALANIAGDVNHAADYLAQLAFNEEPVTILIEENSRSDFPETHVPVQVNGKPAEVLQNGKWLPIGWLPVGIEITTKRKYVEVLARSKTDGIKTVHDEGNVERPRNTVQRRTSANYPMSILEDRNPKGREWLSRVRMGL